MNITHYCSKCRCFHPDVPCGTGYKVHPCPTCLHSPCVCPDCVVDYEKWKEKYPNIASINVKLEEEESGDAKHEAELHRVQDALNWYNEHTRNSFSNGDAIRAHALGVIL